MIMLKVEENEFWEVVMYGKCGRLEISSLGKHKTKADLLKKIQEFLEMPNVKSIVTKKDECTYSMACD